MQLTRHWAARLDDYAIDIAWSADGARLAAASAAGPLSILSGSDGAALHALPGHEGGANAVAWAPTGAVLASGGQDGKVKFWDAVHGQHIATVAMGPAWVDHLAWMPRIANPAAGPAADATEPPRSRAPDRRSGSSLQPCLAAAAGRKLVLIAADGSPGHAFPDAPKTVSALAWRPAGSPLLAAAHFGGVDLWDPAAPETPRTLPYANSIHALAWSPDGRWLVSGNQDPSVHLWIPGEDIELHMSGYEGKVRHLSFDPSGRWLATSGGRDACIWDCSGPGPEGRTPAMLPHDAPVCALAFQRSHGLLATASQDGVLHLWSPERPQPLRATVRMPSAASRISWSPDDGLVAVGTEAGTVFVLKNA